MHITRSTQLLAWTNQRPRLTLPAMPSRLRRVDEPGHTHFWTISCYRRLQFFHDDGMKRVAVAALWRLRQRFGVCLLAYVVMPEHLHVLLYPQR